MKYRVSFLLAVSILLSSVYADTPPFSSSPFQVVLEPTAKHRFNPDPAHTQNGKLVYSLNGQVFSDSGAKVTPSAGSTARSTPYETLSELLVAYHTIDIDKIRSLYTPESASFFDGLISKPEVKERWLEMMKKITGASVLMSLDHGGTVIVFLHIEGEGAGYVTPLAFTKSDKGFLCTANIGGSDVVVTNLMLAFGNFQMKPSEMVVP
jgi:hypothetical protein